MGKREYSAELEERMRRIVEAEPRNVKTWEMLAHAAKLKHS